MYSSYSQVLRDVIKVISAATSFFLIKKDSKKVTITAVFILYDIGFTKLRAN